MPLSTPTKNSCGSSGVCWESRRRSQHNGLLRSVHPNGCALHMRWKRLVGLRSIASHQVLLAHQFVALDVPVGGCARGMLNRDNFFFAPASVAPGLGRRATAPRRARGRKRSRHNAQNWSSQCGYTQQSPIYSTLMYIYFTTFNLDTDGQKSMSLTYLRARHRRNSLVLEEILVCRPCNRQSTRRLRGARSPAFAPPARCR